MRRVSWRILLCGVSLAGLLSAAPAYAGSPQMKSSAKDAKTIEENQALDKKFFAAFNARNADAITATYWNSPDVISVQPDGTVEKGFDEIKNGWTLYFSQIESVQIDQLDPVYVVQGDAVVGTGRARIVQRMKGGQEMSVILRYSDVRRKVGGQWVYTMDSVVPVAAIEPNASLYKRLGGYDGCAAVTDEFMKRLAADPKLVPFLGGLSANSLQHLRQLLVDQVCYVTGGPCLYIGRDMKTAHKGLGITKEHWNLAGNHLAESLDALHIGATEKAEFLKIIATLEVDIVEK